jgi:hypothetical protein
LFEAEDGWRYTLWATNLPEDTRGWRGQCAYIEPRRAKATLGTMLGHLRANRDRFSLVIVGADGQGDVGPLIECLTLLWEGQSSRHGSSVPTRKETLDEATMALHLAVMLVQWFTSGAVRRSGENLAG